MDFLMHDSQLKLGYKSRSSLEAVSVDVAIIPPGYCCILCL